MKLLIDKKSNKVLLAEAGKDVIDFLFGLLDIPVGSIVNLLTKESMVGCIGNLYKSVETIDESYIIFDKEIRSSLLNPAAAAKITHFLLESSLTTSAAKKYYQCPPSMYCDCVNYFTDVHGIECPDCSEQMTQVVSRAFVGRGVTYNVMDDLTVTRPPKSTITSIKMLDKFHVKDVGSLEERNVNLGMNEGLCLLKASLQSKTVLTDVFMGKKLGTESTSSRIKA